MYEWVQINKADFERDILRDFCHVSVQLAEQFERFDETGGLSFPVLRGIIGEPMNKGLLWRLKDKSHHVFLRATPVVSSGRLLDWTLGYIFHETLKLMEDAHQMQYYAPQLGSLDLCVKAPDIAGIKDSLRNIVEETLESMRRETKRIADLLGHSRSLFILHFTGAYGHKPLARFLNDNEALARRIFGSDFEVFTTAVYGEEPERLYIGAAVSLLESARDVAASRALERALQINPSSSDALELKEAHGL